MGAKAAVVARWKRVAVADGRLVGGIVAARVRIGRPTGRCVVEARPGRRSTALHVDPSTERRSKRRGARHAGRREHERVYLGRGVGERDPVVGRGVPLAAFVVASGVARLGAALAVRPVLPLRVGGGGAREVGRRCAARLVGGVGIEGVAGGLGENWGPTNT